MRLRSTRGFFVVSCGTFLAFTTLLGACSSGTEEGGLVLALQTDLSLPKDVNVVRIVISVDGDDAPVHDQEYPVGPGPTDTKIPSTLVVRPSKTNPTARMRAKIIAIKDSIVVDGTPVKKPRVLREVTTVVPTTGKARMLRVPLKWLCYDDRSIDAEAAKKGEATSACGNGTTCVAGACVDSYVDPAKLPDFSEDDVFGKPRVDDSTKRECFNVFACMAQPGDPTTTALAVDVTSQVDAATCSFPKPEGDALSLNVAFKPKAPGSGICDDSGQRCFFPLDHAEGSAESAEGLEGWSLDAAGTRVLLPKGFCSGGSPTRKAPFELGARVVVSSGCTAKTVTTPTCAPWVGGAESVTSNLPPPIGADAAVEAGADATTEAGPADAGTDARGDATVTDAAADAKNDATVADGGRDADADSGGDAGPSDSGDAAPPADATSEGGADAGDAASVFDGGGRACTTASPVGQDVRCGSSSRRFAGATIRNDVLTVVERDQNLSTGTLRRIGLAGTPSAGREFDALSTVPLLDISTNSARIAVNDDAVFLWLGPTVPNIYECYIAEPSQVNGCLGTRPLDHAVTSVSSNGGVDAMVALGNQLAFTRGPSNPLQVCNLQRNVNDSNRFWCGGAGLQTLDPSNEARQVVAAPNTSPPQFFWFRRPAGSSMDQWHVAKTNSSFMPIDVVFTNRPAGGMDPGYGIGFPIFAMYREFPGTAGEVNWIDQNGGGPPSIHDCPTGGTCVGQEGFRFGFGDPVSFLATSPSRIYFVRPAQGPSGQIIRACEPAGQPGMACRDGIASDVAAFPLDSLDIVWLGYVSGHVYWALEDGTIARLPAP